MSIFSQVPTQKVKRNKFDLTHDRKFSGKMGSLIPSLVMDVIPNDIVKIKPSAMVRFAPLIAPVMHRANVYMHFFYVPNRILWKNWPDFISGGEDGLQNPVLPYTNYNPEGFGYSTLQDYMGLPCQGDVIAGGNLKQSISLFPFAAYNKIYNEYYRDENLQPKLIDDLQDGELNSTLFGLSYNLQQRAWQHDYFTASLPWVQKGPESLLPLGTEAPVTMYPWTQAGDNTGQEVRYTASNQGTGNSNPIDGSTGGGQLQTNLNDVFINLGDTHYADLTSATAASINDLRRAIALQQWLEANARGGTRYPEFIKVMFGREIGDARVQRPEFIGGTSTPIKISEVLQTSETTQTGTPQATMAGHGISVGGGQWLEFSVPEHGYVIGIMSIMPKSSYQQGFPKHFLKTTDRFDYYFRQFAHIGEQPVYNKEIAWSGDIDYNIGIFGYTPRYAEYKFMNNTVHGDFKGNLDFWHMGRKFSQTPNLNSDFIQMKDADINRIFAVQDGSDNMWCQVLNEVKAIRPMPVFGTPKII